MSVGFSTIGIMARRAGDEVGSTLMQLVEQLRARSLSILLDQAADHWLTDPAIPRVSRDTLGKKSDLIIVIGGDGTFIGAARNLAQHQVPLLGINLGRLGFLTDVSPDAMGRILDELLAGNYHQETRLMLSASIWRNDELLLENLAVNDVVLHTRDLPRLIEFETQIDGRPINLHRADGIIACTPTGSTAYALSGGGPVLHPSLQAMGLVPICSHTLTDRPIVVPADSQIEIVLGAETNQALVSWDGQVNRKLECGDRLCIVGNRQTMTLIHPADYAYFDILRSKLRWGRGG